eukprot:95966_1
MIGYVIAFSSSLDCWVRGLAGVHLFYYTMIIANGSMSIGGACVYFFFCSESNIYFICDGHSPCYCLSLCSLLKFFVKSPASHYTLNLKSVSVRGVTAASILA